MQRTVSLLVTTMATDILMYVELHNKGHGLGRKGQLRKEFQVREDYVIAVSTCVFRFVLRNRRRLHTDLHYLHGNDSVRIPQH